MPKFRILSLLAAAMAPLCLNPAPARADDALTARIMAALAAIPQRQAAFDDEKQIAALTQPLHSSGILRLRRPDYLEKLTLQPSREDLIIYRDNLSIAQGNDAPHVVDLSGQPQFRTMIDALRAPLTGDLPDVQRLFAIASSGAFDGWHMVLTPHGGAEGFVHQVLLDGRGADVTRLTIHQANGDIETMHIRPQP